MKKVLCMLLVLAMVLSILVISANAAEIDEAESGAPKEIEVVGVESDIANNGAALHTQAEAVAWAKDKADNHRTVGDGWCSALASGYINYLTGSYLQVNGKDYATNYPSGWTATKYYSGYVPQAGDLVVYDYSAWAWVDGVQCGHVGIVYSANSSSFTSIEQNIDGRYTQFCYNRAYNNSNLHVWGFVRPNFPSPVVKPSNAWVNYRYSAIPTGTANYFTFGATNATSYNIRIDKDGVLWRFDQGVSSGQGYMFWDAGNYTVWVAAINSSGLIESYKMNFTVFVPITLGQSFVAEITNSKGAMNLSGTDNYNTVLETKSDSDSQKWRFELQSNNTYKITNVKYGLCMDVVNSKTESGTNIGIWNDNSMDAQRYYLRETNNGYAIVPMVNTGLALDINYGSLASGTNITDYTYHGLWNQSFSIDPIDITPTVTQEYNGHTYEYYEMAVPWEQAVRICEKKGGHLVTISNQAENDIVSGMISDSIWLGARTLGKDSSWFWTNCEIMTYTNWSSSQPDYYKDIEFFVMMYSATGKWNDYPNTTAVNFVCEYDNGDVNAEKYTPSKTIEKNGITYDIFDYSVDWQTAEAICEAKGGHLVKIDSAEKNQTFFELINEGCRDVYWFDATDRFSEGIWTDHEGISLTYTNWQEGEPNNDFNIEQYGAMLESNKQWADYKGYNPIYRSIGFICEYEPKHDILGDSDGNGQVSAIDVTQIMRNCAKIDTGIDEDVLMNGDVDGNGKLEIIDATWIQRHLAKMDTPYAIGETKG